MANGKQKTEEPNERRLGKFEISDLLMEREGAQRTIRRILDKCEVFARTRSPHERKTTYFARCADFDELPTGEELPLYMWSYDRATDTLSCERAKEEL